MHLAPTLLACLSLLAAPSWFSRATPEAWPRGERLRLVRVASGLESPVHLTAPRGDSRLFIVEQPGRIRIVRNGQLLAAPFLDLTDRVGYGGERGLLSVAFHPRYAENGRLFVNYTDRAGNTQVVRFTVSRDSNRADPASARPILSVNQPYANHNGGHIVFGPDGMLYVGMGDGGSGGDPHGNGQNLGTLLGKLLRLDVDRGDPYAIPADNPFVGRRGARGEIWAYGLRNPWRLWFDASSGQLYIGDVGQNRWEEVDVAPARAAGLNYGWNRMEAMHPFRIMGRVPGLTSPIVEYSHDVGCSVTGGLVYRGRSVPELAGAYVFGDYCRGWVRSFRLVGGRAADRREWDLGDAGSITSFGEDGSGELYVLAQRGDVYRVARR